MKRGCWRLYGANARSGANGQLRRKRSKIKASLGAVVISESSKGMLKKGSGSSKSGWTSSKRRAGFDTEHGVQKACMGRHGTATHR
eukprot:1261885-Alexandrium_andersonii.AAC.1